MAHAEGAAGEGKGGGAKGAERGGEGRVEDAGEEGDSAKKVLMEGGVSAKDAKEGGIYVEGVFLSRLRTQSYEPQTPEGVNEYARGRIL